MASEMSFTSDRSGERAIWVVDREGKYPLRLTSFGGDGGVDAPRWSPDGKEIAFDLGRRNSDNVDIWVISASGGPKEQDAEGKESGKGASFGGQESRRQYHTAEPKTEGRRQNAETRCAST
jgi:Tol biopolymer transport system component